MPSSFLTIVSYFIFSKHLWLHIYIKWKNQEQLLLMFGVYTEKEQ